ncbi:MAG: glycerol-3-phosphate 1-O-acyltransferase PlsY [Cyanobacteriota bacterium]|nr:glycerol-3-phosphate 1-O-acyltransferase PlsY [Cyanobacteriota bacterium]
MNILFFLGCGLMGYLLGSIPTGYWVGRWWKGIDIREHGSGSIGATNILRTVGKGPAALVLGVDALKGGLAVLMAQTLMAECLQRQLLSLPESGIPWVGLLAGLAAVIGHGRSIWLGFKGGKSVATSLGVLLAMSWPAALSILGVWLAGIGLSRIVSLSSIVAAMAAPLIMFGLGQALPYGLFALAGGLYVLGSHRRNMERLWAGTEPRIGQKLPETLP